jgi:hypothetical protein
MNLQANAPYYLTTALLEYLSLCTVNVIVSDLVRVELSRLVSMTVVSCSFRPIARYQLVLRLRPE